jgi:hypothetical protein
VLAAGRQRRQVDVFRQRHARGVHPEHLEAALQVRRRNVELHVQPARAHQSGVDGLRAVCACVRACVRVCVCVWMCGCVRVCKGSMQSGTEQDRRDNSGQISRREGWGGEGVVLACGRFVAASTSTPVASSMPSISVRRAERSRREAESVPSLPEREAAE